MTQLAKVFELNRQGFNIARGVAIAGPAAAARRWRDPSGPVLAQRDLRGAVHGGERSRREVRAPGAALAVIAVAGALLTALGFGIGPGAWGWVVLAAFVATLLGGLAVKYGVHRFVAAYLLNVWFIIALGLPTSSPCLPRCTTPA